MAGQRKEQRRKQRGCIVAYEFVRQIPRLDQGAIINALFSDSPGDDEANQFHERMSPLPTVCLRRFLLVPVILSLASPSRFPLELFCPAPGMRCCCCDIRAVHPVGTGLRSLRDSPFREENYKQVNVYDTTGWVYLGTLRTDCTGKCQVFCSLCKCSENRRAISSSPFADASW